MYAVRSKLGWIVQWVGAGLVYWQWDAYETRSHLHKMHPVHAGMTWCGCNYAVGQHPGVIPETVHERPPLSSLPPDVELCSDCLSMAHPLAVPHLNDPQTRNISGKYITPSLKPRKDRREKKVLVEELEGV